MKSPCLFSIIIFFFFSCNNIKTSQRPISEQEILDIGAYDSLALALNDSAVNLLIKYSDKSDTLFFGLLWEGLELIDSAIAIDDSYPLLYPNKMQILSNLGKIESAISTFYLAYEKHPDNPYLFFSRGILSAKQEDYINASNDFRIAFNLFETSPLATIQFDFKHKEIAYMLGYGKEKSEKRLDSILKLKDQVFYDRSFKRYILSIDIENVLKNW